jgi:hypothetical protein
MNENPYSSPYVGANQPGDASFPRSSYQYKPMWRLLLANKVLAILATGSEAAVILLDFTLTASSSSASTSYADISFTEIFNGLVALATIPVLIAWNIVFLIATYRVVANAHVVSASPPATSAGFAVGSYFIPIVNLFMPYVAMKKAYQACGAAAQTLLGCWWAAHITSVVLSQISLRLSMASMRESAASQAHNIDYFASTIELVELPFSVALAVLSHLVLSRLAARQEVLASQPHAVAGWSPAVISPPSQSFSSWGGD